MPEFTLRFDPENSYFHSKDFGENLALRLLDVLCGRHEACIPEPVPYTDKDCTTRQIGYGNNFWLIRGEDCTYRVIARYESDKRRLRAAEVIIRDHYRNSLLPEPVRQPRERPPLARPAF